MLVFLALNKSTQQASQDQHQAYFCLSLDNEDGKHL